MLATDGETLHGFLRQVENHAAMVESQAAGIDHQQVSHGFRVDLVSMPDDEDIGLEVR